MTNFYFKSIFFSFCSLSIPSAETHQYLVYLYTFTLPLSVVSLFFLFLLQVFSFSTRRSFPPLPSPLPLAGVQLDRELSVPEKEKEEAYSYPISLGYLPAPPLPLLHPPTHTDKVNINLSPPSFISPSYSSYLIITIFIHIPLVSPILKNFFLILAYPSSHLPISLVP